MIRWAKRDEVFTSGVKLIPVEKNVDKMTDRERMIDIILDGIDGTHGQKYIAELIADNLIEAGFGRANKCPCGCSHIGDDVCMDPECELMRSYK